MLGAVAGGARRDHLAALGHEIAKDRRVLVVHVDDAVHAETADFAPGRTPAAGTPAVVAAMAAGPVWTGPSRLKSRCWHWSVLSLEGNVALASPRFAGRSDLPGR